jgi:hypothetical protein
MTITQWIAPELPHYTTEDEDGHEVKKDWGQLKTEIDERIIDKITGQLVMWEEENGIISDLEALVVTEIRENLLGMTEEMQQFVWLKVVDKYISCTIICHQTLKHLEIFHKFLIVPP